MNTDPRNVQASVTATPSVRCVVAEDRTLLVKVHGRNPAAMLAMADRIGGMQRRRLDHETQQANATGDRFFGRTTGTLDNERKGGLKVDNVPPVVSGAINASIGDFVRALIDAGYVVTELFFQTEEVRDDRKGDGVKSVLQATIRKPVAADSSPVHAHRAFEQRPATESIEAMLPRFLAELDALVGTRLDVYPNPDRPDGNGGINRGTVTVNLTGPTDQAVKNRLGFENGELTLTEIPKPPKAPKAPAAAPTAAQ